MASGWKRAAHLAPSKEGADTLNPAQLSMLLEGLERRRPLATKTHNVEPRVFMPRGCRGLEWANQLKTPARFAAGRSKRLRSHSAAVRRCRLK